ncbi:MAG: hypothetical protein HY314_11480 [Acidobacteria bacterium]|nr:hypothetical protein [Acidobacteriota bacterium]
MISNSARTASVRAKTALDVVTVSRAAFKELLTHVPGVKSAMEEIMSQHLGRGVDLAEEIHE